MIHGDLGGSTAAGGGGNALTTDPLSQFAATTSAQLAGVISNETGTGLLVFNTSPTLVTPLLGTPTSVVLTNATGLPITTGVSGLGANVAAFLATPSSANLAAALTNETGTGLVVFNDTPTLIAPILGTPTSGNASNLTALNATQLTTGAVPAARMPALTGDVTTVAGNVATTISVGAVTDVKASLLVKPAVMVVAVSNLALMGEQTIDGTLTSGSLVLLTGQTAPAENGPWVTAAGAWARPGWYTSGSTTQAPQFLTTFVRLGTTYSGSTWRMTTAAVTIDTTSTTWAHTPVSLEVSNVTNTLGVANGGTGITSLGTGVATFLGTPSSANLLAALTTKTGTGLAVFATSPSITTGILDANSLPLLAFTATASAVYGLTLANAALLGTVALGVTAPTQAASAVAGTPISITASVAVAGSSNAGAAAGGAITITSGAAARLTSGNANGGSISLITGAGIGTGTAPAVSIGSANVTGSGTVLSLTSSFGTFTLSVSSAGLSITGTTLCINGFQVGDSGVFSLGTTADTFIRRGAAATLQIGAADVNGSAVAQTLRVQSAITGTDQAAANFTIQGSRQTGAGTTGQIIFQTSPKLASGTTQGTYVTALTLTAPAVNMNPSVVIGNQALATTATDGFLYIAGGAGAPTGVPTAFTGRYAIYYDSITKTLWINDAGWLQPKTPAGAAIVTWQ